MLRLVIIIGLVWFLCGWFVICREGFWPLDNKLPKRHLGALLKALAHSAFYGPYIHSVSKPPKA